MFYPVLKPFNTANRRLAPSDGPGGRMTIDDVFEPFTLADLLGRKFLGDPQEENVAVSGALVPGQMAPADGMLDITTSPVKEDIKDSPKAARASEK